MYERSSHEKVSHESVKTVEGDLNQKRKPSLRSDSKLSFDKVGWASLFQLCRGV